MAVLHASMLHHNNKLSTAATRSQGNGASMLRGSSQPADADAEGDRDGSAWLSVEMENDGRGEEEEVRTACLRLLHQCSCIPAGGLGGSSEAEEHVEARVATTVYCLTSWATVLLHNDEAVEENRQSATRGSAAADASSESGGQEQSRCKLRATVLESVLESKESKDILDFGTLTARHLAQVLQATAGSIFRRRRSCIRVLSPLMQRSDPPESKSVPSGRNIMASLLGGGASSIGSAEPAGEADASPHAWAMTQALALLERELKAQLESEQRVRLARHLDRDSAESEVAGKLLDESRLIALSWQTAERKRRGVEICDRGERALWGRKAWRSTLKSACHQGSIWQPCFSRLKEETQLTPATIFGESVSTFSDFWRVDAREAGAPGVRRRLKRDTEGSAHRQQSYLAFLDPSCDLSRSEEVKSSHNLSGLAGLDLQTLRACVSRRDSGQGDEAGNKAALKVECLLVSTDGNVSGSLLLSSTALIFSCTREGDDCRSLKDMGYRGETGSSRMAWRRPQQQWNLVEMVRVEGRRYLLRATALEISFAGGSSVMFNFPGDTCASASAHVTLIYKRLCANAAALPNSKLRMWYMSDPPRSLKRYGLTQAWVERKISNFEYLMALNAFAGRTMHDLTQYPVMPWVLADYESPVLDLSDPNVYRDLAKPIGCQRSSQEEVFKERFRTWADDEIKPFHYGSHYSTAGVVLWYLLRLEPYTSSAINLQEGHLDCPDRLFRSLAEAYHGCTHSTTDVKELIPEFFYLPDFLVNRNRLDLGMTQHGQRVDDVELPPWAEDAVSFIAIHRRALESDYVSSRLHLWIDLIFGCKQRGDAAVEAVNVYYYLTYEGQVDLAAIEDEMLRTATEAQVVNFGQTPRQLFTSSHPQRLPKTAVALPLFSSVLVSDDTATMPFIDDAGQDHLDRGEQGGALPSPAKGKTQDFHTTTSGRADLGWSAQDEQCGWQVSEVSGTVNEIRSSVETCPDQDVPADSRTPANAVLPAANAPGLSPPHTASPVKQEPSIFNGTNDDDEASAAPQTLPRGLGKSRPTPLETVSSFAAKTSSDMRHQGSVPKQQGSPPATPATQPPRTSAPSPLSSPGSRCSRTTSTDSRAAADACVVVDDSTREMGRAGIVSFAPRSLRASVFVDAEA